MTLKHPGGSGAGVWFFQRISGVVLLLLLGLHFLVQHFTGGGDVTRMGVLARLASPWWLWFDVFFAALALYHGLNGVWMVTEDYLHKNWQRLLIWAGLVTMGLGLFALAVITLIPLSKVA
jgi:succinate dehydrogenase / fumarate reductase membrane anchor subunit